MDRHLLAQKSKSHTDNTDDTDAKIVLLSFFDPCKSVFICGEVLGFRAKPSPFNEDEGEMALKNAGRFSVLVCELEPRSAARWAEVVFVSEQLFAFANTQKAILWRIIGKLLYCFVIFTRNATSA